MGHRTSLGPRRPGRIDLFGTLMRLISEAIDFCRLKMVPLEIWEEEEYFSFIVRFFSIQDTTDIEKMGYQLR